MRGALGIGVILALAFVGVDAQQQATFRVRTDVVLVPVSVMKGREPATGLTPADFEITDNGVRQTVDSIAADQVPIDVTLVLTGQSRDRHGELSRILVGAEATRKLLHPTDRLRMVWVTDEVAGSVVAGEYSIATDPAARRLGDGIATASGAVQRRDDEATWKSGFGIALADGLFYALAWPVDAARRHLVVVFTDGWDSTSTIAMDTLPTLAAHSDAVLHAVLWAAPGEDSRNGGGLNFCCASAIPIRTREWQVSYDILGAVVRRTGGTLQRTNKAPEALAEVIADFRSSYVLRYSPRGVAPTGWHELDVKVTRPGSFKIRARKGYENR